VLASNLRSILGDFIIERNQISVSNPLNWKYGGSYDEDYEAGDASTKYDISIAPNSRSCKRPYGDNYTPLQAIKAQCDSFYQVDNDEFWIYGAGWAQGDSGIEIFNQMSHCIGSNVTEWSFKYYNIPDDKGREYCYQYGGFRRKIHTLLRTPTPHYRISR
jgi:hypothetical protein